MEGTTKEERIAFTGAVLDFRRAVIASFGHNGADNGRDVIKSRILELYRKSADEKSKYELRQIVKAELGRPEANAPEQLNTWLVYLAEGLFGEMLNLGIPAQERAVRKLGGHLRFLQMLQTGITIAKQRQAENQG